MDNVVTVIVPVYNVEKYLERCIESICKQTYQNLQIILINDGSTDSSEKICQKWKDIDSRITLISTINQGVSAARNLGLDIAEGDFISFVDSDDYIEANMYEILVLKMRLYNTEIVFCDYTKYDYKDKLVKSDMLIDRDIIMNSSDVLNMKFDGIRNNIAVTVVWNKLYRAHLFQNIRFPVGKIHEDEFIMCKLFYEANKIVFIPDRLYNYCENRNSLNSVGFKLGKFDRIEAMKLRLNDDHLKNEITLKNKLTYEYLYNYIRTYKNFVESKQYSKNVRMNIYIDMKQEFKKHIKSLSVFNQIKIYIWWLLIGRK